MYVMPPGVQSEFCIKKPTQVDISGSPKNYLNMIYRSKFQILFGLSKKSPGQLLRYRNEMLMVLSTTGKKCLQP